ncbi:MAG: hypothetical protein ACN2B6_06315 [Rickettsiales bacterium]
MAQTPSEGARRAVNSLDAARTKRTEEAPVRREAAMNTVVGGTPEKNAALQRTLSEAARKTKEELDTLVGVTPTAPTPKTERAQSAEEQKFEKLMAWVTGNEKITPEQLIKIMSATRVLRENTDNPTPANFIKATTDVVNTVRDFGDEKLTREVARFATASKMER